MNQSIRAKLKRETANLRKHQEAVYLHSCEAYDAAARIEVLHNALLNNTALTDGMNIQCVREWTAWLKQNGPAPKSTIQQETGIKFNERGTPYTIKWLDRMVHEDMDDVDDDTIVKFTIRTLSRGGSPVVYALWSQRFEVRPRYGVGPVPPMGPLTAEDLADIAAEQKKDARVE